MRTVREEMSRNLLKNNFFIFTRDEERPSAVEASEVLKKRSSIFDRYQRVFVESVRESPLPLPDEESLSVEGHNNILI